MELLTLNEINLDQFNRFTADHPSGSFLQSWQWGQWQEHLGHRALRFFVQDDSQILLSAQVIQVHIPRLKKYYLYIPYGPLLVDSPTKDGVLKYFITELKKKYPESLFTRIEPKDQLAIIGRPTNHIQPGKTLIADLKQTEEQLLAGMHPKTRYNIKVATRHNLQINSEPIVTPGYGLYLQEALSLLTGTAKRQEFKGHSSVYYKKLIDFFGTQPAEQDCTVAVYKALYQQQLLAVALMVDFGKTRTYLFGGTAAEQKNLMAPYALHWQAMQDAKNKGLTNYDFWGIETSSGKVPGFVRFKLGWGGTTVSYPTAIDIIQRQSWYNVYRVLRSLNRKF